MALATVHTRYSSEQIESYYAAGLWTRDTLFDCLEQQVAQRGEKVFLTDSTMAYTFQELHDEALRLAAGLAGLGLRAGDRVAIQVPNWAEFGVLAVAIARLGAVIVPIMTIYRRDEVGYMVQTANVKAVFTAGEYKKFDHAGMFLDLAQQCESLEHVIVLRSGGEVPVGATALEDVVTSADLSTAAAQIGIGVTADEPFVIVFSSGTTSMPKGCLHTFNTMSTGGRLLGRGWNYTADDVQFGPSPVTHTTGLVTSIILPLLHGAASHIVEAWEPRDGLKRIAEHRCTAAVTATTFLQMLVNVYDPDEHDASSLRFWCSAGAPIPSSFVEKARTALPKMQVLSLYGRTENITTTMCTVSDDPSRSVTSDGHALPGQEVRIVDELGLEVERGQEGDIAYRGAMNCLEYIGQPELTADMFTVEGFSRSGDLGVMDADGYVRVTGRLKDIVIRGGLNISVRQVEDLLVAHPQVGDVAVVGMPDEKMGERVCCYLIPAGDEVLTLEEIKDYLLGLGLAIQKVPERLEIIDALPMTATGKVQKHVLRQDIAAKLKA
jgi:acyl-coenzyme A synthetase/AMP-(fatty) acid ligase